MLPIALGLQVVCYRVDTSSHVLTQDAKLRREKQFVISTAAITSAQGTTKKPSTKPSKPFAPRNDHFTARYVPRTCETLTTVTNTVSPATSLEDGS